MCIVLIFQRKVFRFLHSCISEIDFILYRQSLLFRNFCICFCIIDLHITGKIGKPKCSCEISLYPDLLCSITSVRLLSCIQFFFHLNASQIPDFIKIRTLRVLSIILKVIFIFVILQPICPIPFYNCPYSRLHRINRRIFSNPPIFHQPGSICRISKVKDCCHHFFCYRRVRFFCLRRKIVVSSIS